MRKEYWQFNVLLAAVTVLYAATVIVLGAGFSVLCFKIANWILAR